MRRGPRQEPFSENHPFVLQLWYHKRLTAHHSPHLAHLRAAVSFFDAHGANLHYHASRYRNFLKVFSFFLSRFRPSYGVYLREMFP
jgi:hypothetical protein